MTVRIIQGDAIVALRTLDDRSAHCCVTSPPYWGLRDYGVAGQIGLEPTIAEYVEKMVAVFREVRRVLRDDGTLWLNLGDSYTGSANAGGDATRTCDSAPNATDRNLPIKRGIGLKPKDLCGIPWRVAFALQADGWYLRQDIIWAKPNPMPESVRDRCTKAHEYIFLLSKSGRYYYDAEAIAEPVTQSTVERLSQPMLDQQEGSFRVPGKTNGPMKAVGAGRKDRVAHNGAPIQSGFAAARNHNQGYPTRNKRSVWTVTTQPFKEAHFAAFPPALIEPCILAGCPVGGTVLDPFGGAGTTGLVADRFQRDAVLIELNPAYADMARTRIVGDAPMFAAVAP